jgi:hypothetical protein
MPQLQTKLASRRNTLISVNGTNYKVDGNGCVDVPDGPDANRLLAIGEFSKEVVKLGPTSIQPAPGASLRNARDFVEFLEGNTDYAERVNSARSFNTIRALGQQGGFMFTEVEWKQAIQARAATHAATATPAPTPAAETPKKKKAPAPEADRQVLEGSNLLLDTNAKPASAQVPAEIANANKTDNGNVVIPPTIDDQLDLGDEDGDNDGGPPLVQADQALAPTVVADAAAVEALKKLPAYCFAGKIPEKIPEEAKDGEWPDPVPEMSMPYLRRMGNAYNVKFPAGTTKEAAIEMLKKEMYEP